MSFVEFSSKKSVAIKRIIGTWKLLCSKQMVYHIATKMQVIDKIFKLTIIYAPVTCQIHWTQ